MNTQQSAYSLLHTVLSSSYGHSQDATVELPRVLSSLAEFSSQLLYLELSA